MKGLYRYVPRGRNWVVYKYDDESRVSARPVKTFFTRDEARDEVYRLNGWKTR